jgi:hypothetical protein
MNRTYGEDQEKPSAIKPDYLILCYGSLFVVLLALINRNFGLASVFPILVGILALVFHWQSGPVLLLLSLVWLFVADSLGLTPMAFAAGILRAILGPLLGLAMAPPFRSFSRAHPREAMPVVDFILCLGAVGFCVGHYRLQSILGQIFPLDTRKKDPNNASNSGYWFWRVRAKPIKEKRPKGLVNGKELVLCLFLIQVCAALAEMGWLVLSLNKGNRAFDLPGGLWRTILLTWIFGLGMLAAGFFINYFTLLKQPAEEQFLASQDSLWQETRIEQRTMARLLAKYRLKRASRRKRT